MILSLFGCKTSEGTFEPQLPDAVSAAPEKKIFTSRGGVAEIVVTSNGEWSLSGDYSWITPSQKKGNDGDIIVFTAEENQSESERTAVFMLTSGQAESKLTFICKKKEVEIIEDEIYVTPEEDVFESEGGITEVIVTSTSDWTLAGEYDWVIPSAYEGKDGDVVTFEILPNDSGEERTAGFVFTSGEASAEFTVKELAAGEVKDAISIAPGKETVSCDGGIVETVVTSTGEWTLSGDYDWVEVSAASGNDGDVVTFTVSANETAEDRVAVFEFACGTATAEFTVVSQKGEQEADRISIAPESESVSADGGEVQVVVTSSGAWTLEGECDWAVPSLKNGNDGDIVVFEVSPNTSGAPKSCTFTFKTGTASEIFTLRSLASSGNYITLLSPSSYDLEIEATRLKLQLETNTYYRDLRFEFDGNAGTWIKHYMSVETGAESVDVYFDITENVTLQNRTGVFRILAGGKEVEITVNQKGEITGPIITKVLNFSMNFAKVNWNQSAPVKDLKNFTFETIINVSSSSSGKNIGGSIGNFYLTMTGGGTQVALNYGDGTLTDASLILTKNKWYHLAVTFDNGTATIYLNGEAKVSGQCGSKTTLDITNFHFPGNDRMKCVTAQYSEVRVWNRTLSADDISATNHYYVADPSSAGLIGYWKLNDGSEPVKDWSIYGSSLTFNSSLSSFYWKSVQLGGTGIQIGE